MLIIGGRYSTAPLVTLKYANTLGPQLGAPCLYTPLRDSPSPQPHIWICAVL